MRSLGIRFAGTIVVAASLASYGCSSKEESMQAPPNTPPEQGGPMMGGPNGRYDPFSGGGMEPDNRPERPQRPPLDEDDSTGE